MLHYDETEEIMTSTSTIFEAISDQIDVSFEEYIDCNMLENQIQNRGCHHNGYLGIFDYRQQIYCYKKNVNFPLIMADFEELDGMEALHDRCHKILLSDYGRLLKGFIAVEINHKNRKIRIEYFDPSLNCWTHCQDGIIVVKNISEFAGVYPFNNLHVKIDLELMTRLNGSIFASIGWIIVICWLYGLLNFSCALPFFAVTFLQIKYPISKLMPLVIDLSNVAQSAKYEFANYEIV